MTLQNAPPGLDYERDKRFSKVFDVFKLLYSIIKCCSYRALFFSDF